MMEKGFRFERLHCHSPKWLSTTKDLLFGVGAHTAAINVERWYTGLQMLDASDVVSALRASRKPSCPEDVLNVGDYLGEESLHREYKIQRELKEMDEKWIRKMIRDHLHPLVNGATGTCELWLGIDDKRGTIIGSYLDEEDFDLERAIPSCLFLFPPLETMQVTKYAVRLTLGETQNMKRRRYTKLKSALDMICELNGKAWLVEEGAEDDDTKFWVVAEKLILDETSETDQWEDLPRHFDVKLLRRKRFVFKIAVTVNPKFTGLYVVNEKEFGKDEDGGKLSGFGVWLRLRKSFSLSTRLKLGSTLNFRLKIHSDSNTDTSAFHSVFDYSIPASKLSETSNNWPEERLGEMLFQSTALNRIAIVDVCNWKLLRKIIDLDMQRHYSEDRKPRYDVVLLSPLHDGKDRNESRMAQLAEAIRGLKKDDGVVYIQDILSSELFHCLPSENEITKPVAMATPPIPTLEQVSSWMFPNGEVLRSRRFLPGLVDHHFVVRTEYCRSLNSKISRVVNEFGQGRGGVVQMEVSGESYGCGITTALRIAEHHVKVCHPNVQCLFVDTADELKRAQELISRREAGCFVILVDVAYNGNYFVLPDTRCSVCCVINRGVGYNLPGDELSQRINLRWSRSDLIALADILQKLPFEGCRDIRSRKHSLDEALKHVSSTDPQHFFLLHLAATRGRYMPAEKWIENQLSIAKEKNLEDVLNTIAFLHLNRSNYLVSDPSLTRRLRSSSELLRYSKSGETVLVDFVHPELSRLYLHKTLYTIEFPRASLLPHPGMIINLLVDQISPYLVSLSQRGFHKQIQDTILALFVLGGHTDQISRLSKHFVLNFISYEVDTDVFESPVKELASFMINLPSAIWNEEDRYIQASKLARRTAYHAHKFESENNLSFDGIDFAESAVQLAERAVACNSEQQFKAKNNLAAAYHCRAVVGNFPSDATRAFKLYYDLYLRSSTLETEKARVLGQARSLFNKGFVPHPNDFPLVILESKKSENSGTQGEIWGTQVPEYGEDSQFTHAFWSRSFSSNLN